MNSGNTSAYKDIDVQFRDLFDNNPEVIEAASLLVNPFEKLKVMIVGILKEVYNETHVTDRKYSAWEEIEKEIGEDIDANIATFLEDEGVISNKTELTIPQINDLFEKFLANN